mmetsp:Transcript_61583/g.172094  ORF Transcript_61583/g.172094 Transcript_61583/m.172094 type:complete len:733 (+) Transcript_61583:77-2275(+)
MQLAPRISLLAAAVVWSAGRAASAASAAANPLSKVVTLLDELAARIRAEGEAEAKTYKEFVAWCDGAATSKGFEIKTATAEKEKLEARIGQSSNAAAAAASKIEALAANIAEGGAELTNATSIREKEAADFKSSEAELADIVGTIGRAITLLEREMAQHPSSLAQLPGSGANRGLLSSLEALVDAASFPSADKQRLLGFVQAQQSARSSADADDDDVALGAPAAAIYESRSGNIVEVLEDLKLKAEEQLSDLRKAEVNARHNYEMLKQSLEDQHTADSKDLAAERKAKAAAQETEAASKSDLEVTENALADSKAARQLAEDNCMQAAADHEETTKARAEELKVIAEAKQVLENTTSGAGGQTYSLLQLQERSGSRLHTQTDLSNYEVVNLVKRLAKQQHSAALAQLASRISGELKLAAASGEDAFGKVRALISDLISKLEQESHAEATEKSYCDEQTAANEAKKSELQEGAAGLVAKIDQAAAQSAKLKEDVKELQAGLATLAKQQTEMDSTRAATHAAYAKAKADLELGLQGVRQALSLLRDYYGSAASASALQQSAGDFAALMQQPAAPARHTKASDAGSSIVGVLEVVESDFAEDLAKEELAESDAATEYEKMTQANKVTKAVKEQDVRYKSQEYNALDKHISDLTSDKGTVDAELEAVLEYGAKLKERCVLKPETYESRKARRAAEIRGLKEALEILEGETAFVQRSKRGRSGLQRGHAFLAASKKIA